MKKRYKLLFMIMAVLFCTGWYAYKETRVIQFSQDSNGELVLLIQCGDSKEKIYPWHEEKGDKFYVFFPSFLEADKIYFDIGIAQDIRVSGSKMHWWDKICWEEDEEYVVSLAEKEYHMTFMRSANIPSIYVTTESGNMDYLNEDKEHQENGWIKMVSAEGTIEYDDELKKISARGQSSMWCGKKSYAITLENAKALFGMPANKRWNLLALYYEHDKIHSKIIFDMAKELELEFTPEMEWADLYCNGEYKGLYLLTEHVMLGENRVEIYDLEKDNVAANPETDLDSLNPRHRESDSFFEINNGDNISGGYLLEKKTDGRLGDEEAYFPSSIVPYSFFAVKAPKHTSREQLQYIKTFVQGIETMIAAGDLRYKDYIDMDSFAKQFLIDKITLEVDAMNQSTFFYKDRNSDLLKSGPLWDYDKAMGEIEYDYEMPINEIHGGMNEWYLPLYEDAEFRKLMISYYQELLPYMEKVLDEGIDQYVEYISAAVKMDEMIMTQYDRNDSTRSYQIYENYVRYLKYYMAKRLNYLNALWEIEYPEFQTPPSTGEYHTVTFMLDEDNILTCMEIKDGELLTEMPPLDIEKYYGWQFTVPYSRKLFTDKIPVYEDIVVYPFER